ncbi:hypothetical protein BRD17_07775 [Halobacteriales archaeon SW_7_68_16]|nr:MAG: hypothetical protein BRD17_07775 [Halobacteriales archaeon SW_7_68_16]
MTDWRNRVDELLGEGETVKHRVEYGEVLVIVTDRRVICFGVEGGANYSEAALPNVSTVDVTVASSGVPVAGMLALVVGLPSVVAGIVVETGSLVQQPDAPRDEVSGVSGFGELFGLVDAVFAAVGWVDEGIAVFGLLFVIYGVYELVRYFDSRRSVLRIAVAGAPDDATDPGEPTDRPVADDGDVVADGESTDAMATDDERTGDRSDDTTIEDLFD